MRRITTKDFADGADAVLVEVVGISEQIGTRGGFVTVHAQVGFDKGADEPAPDRALMIGRVTQKEIASKRALIVQVIGG